MALVENQVCDTCGRILFGKDRAAKIVRDALEIKGGQIKTQHVDPHSKWRQYEFITQYAGMDLAFCFDDEEDQYKCFKGYVEAAETRSRLKREQELKDGATRDLSEGRHSGPPRGYNTSPQPPQY